MYVKSYLIIIIKASNKWEVNTKSKKSLKEDKREKLKSSKSNGKAMATMSVHGNLRPTSAHVDNFFRNSKRSNAT